MNSMSNWMNLGLSKEQEQLVQDAAKLYRAIYLDTIDSVFKIAEAIEVLRTANYGGGVQGGFAEALVQYGFTAKDGGAMDKSIRNSFKELLENEAKVRAWWAGVDNRKKRDWLSARAIHRHWKLSLLTPEEREQRQQPSRNDKQTIKELETQVRDLQGLVEEVSGERDSAQERIRELETTRQEPMFTNRTAPCAACVEKDGKIVRLEKELAEVIKVYKNNQGLMTTSMYKTIGRLLHSDNVPIPKPDDPPDVREMIAAAKKERDEVWMLWRGLEKIIPFELTFEQRTGTPKAKMPPPMPRTTTEMWEARQKVRQKRSERAKRGAATRKAKKAASKKD